MEIRFLVVLLSAFQIVYSDVAATSKDGVTTKEIPPYIKVVLCPMQKEPWECFREQSGRVLNILEENYRMNWNVFKDEASKELLSLYQSRGFSASGLIREKTSSLFEKIESGVKDIKEYAAATANELIGREDELEELDEEYEIDDSDSLELELEGEEKDETGNKLKKKKKKKKKKKPQYVTQDAHDDEHEDYEEAEVAAELLGDVGHMGGHGIKFPHKYGRSLGVMRGKKKKKRKGLMKVVLIASLIKAKVELLLKLVSTHLQIKFFAIALLGLLLNLIRFWLDIKRGQAPQKVIYYENAHHQHHYDEPEDWDHGGYWRRTNADSYHDGVEEDSPFSRIGRNDYLPSSPSTSSLLPSSSPYRSNTANRMAYIKQLPTGGRTQ